MTTMKLNGLFKNMTLYQRLIILTLTLSVSVAPIAIAGGAPLANARYVPSRNQKPPSDYSKTTGVRQGCPEITVLAPKTHVGESTATQPTLAWFIFNTSEDPATPASEVTLTLYEFNSKNELNKIGQPISLKMTPGIMTQSLSESQLTKDKRYLWKVETPCQNGRVFQTAEIIIVEMPSSLEKALSTQTDRAKKVDIYAEAGLWYDALGQALALTEKGKLGQVGSNLLQELAEVEQSQISMNINDSKCDSFCKVIKDQISRLKEIAMSDH